MSTKPAEKSLQPKFSKESYDKESKEVNIR